MSQRAQTTTEYRFIDWRNIYILKEDLAAVEEVFAQAGWAATPAAWYPKVTLLAPRTEPYVHTDNYDVLSRFAVYVAIPGSHLILERTQKEPSFHKDWLHIVFDGKGSFWEEVTPQGEYTCQKITGAL